MALITDRSGQPWEKDEYEAGVESKLVAMSRPRTVNRPIQFVQHLNQISYGPATAEISHGKRPYSLTPLEEKIRSIF